MVRSKPAKAKLTGAAATTTPGPETATGPAQSEPAASAAIPEPEEVQSRKQAVVLIHGMGEQVPLSTLREFVETVYQRDTKLPVGAKTYADEKSREEGLRQVWMVPDDATGTAELRRITTPPDANDLRTDFYELYWADITEGTSIEAVLGWVKGLILRPWSAVPGSPKVILAWLFLWAVSILFVTFTISTLDPTGTLFSWLIAPTKQFMIAVHNPLGVLIALGGLFVWAHEHNKPPARVRVTLGLLLVVGGLTLAFLPPPLLESDKVWSGLIALGLATLLNGVIAPYVGDVVRYVRAGPATVEKRRQVRERGLKLLEDLHKKRIGKRPMYERIVVVAHSLGSIVGYDLIQLYWEKHGPTHRFDPIPDAVPAYERINAFVAEVWPLPPKDEAAGKGKKKRKTEPKAKERWKSFDLDGYQQAQSDVFDAIKDVLEFRISDFVTVGSPLTHAQFLLRDDKEALAEEFGERLFSSSPPRPDRPNQMMTYYAHHHWGPFAHFAAPFAAVRWTNIYDECWFPFGGDVVSGSLVETFGPGIREHEVRIARPGVLWPFNRAVTHTLYWAWDKSFRRKTPPYIQHLRDALFLEGAMESRLSDAGTATRQRLDGERKRIEDGKTSASMG